VLEPAAVKARLGQWVIANGEKHAESWVGFHTFRHTCATVLFENGWNAKQVQLQRGHHKPSFTLDTYIHLMPGDLPAHPRSEEGNGTATTPPRTTEKPQLLVLPKRRKFQR
jgi:site-specific recombinase XerC